MRSMAVRVIGVLVCVFVGAIQPARGQSPSASLTGTVFDRTGVAMTDALVDVSGNGLRVRVRTDKDGAYSVPDLPPGTYRVTVSRPGFRSAIHERVAIGLGEPEPPLVVVLDVGAAEALEVEGHRPQPAARVRFTQEQLESIPGSPSASARLSSMPGVVVDRVDIGGNESHRHPEFVFRGNRMLDTAWTIDGVVVTDRQRGVPLGFYDSASLDDITFAPASADITRPGNGLGVNMVVRSGSNQYRGSARGSVMGDWLEASNVRDDLVDAPYLVTSDTTDHTRQIADASADAGGPLLRSRAWFWAYAARRDVRVFRQASGDERTVLSPHTVKLNWQATPRDMINVLWLDHGVSRFGINPSSYRSHRDALQNESSLYADNPFPGLWKIEDRRVVSETMVLSGRYSYYNTGTQVVSVGSGQAGISPRLGQAYGATSSEWSLRPQHSVSADGTYFRRLGRLGHALKFGAGWQRVELLTRTLWSGDGVVAFDISPTDMRARLHREAYGRNRLTFWSGYVSDAIAAGPWTIDVGLRIDHQGAEAGAASVSGNPAFPDLLPGIDYRGETYPSALDFGPRASVTLALGSQRQTRLRASIGRYPSQLVMATAAQPNPTHVPGWIEYPWQDYNGDLLVQRPEVRVDLPPLAFNGVNPLVRSAPVPRAVIGGDVSSRILSSISLSIEREFGRSFSGTLGYNYARHTRWPVTLWRGLTRDDYAVVRQVTQALPDGSVVTEPVYAPNSQKVLENGSQRMLVIDDTYYTSYHGLEAALLKRMSARWTLGATAALNNSRSFYGPEGPRAGPDNPTRLDGAGGPLSGSREPHVEGGQVATATLPVSGGGVLFVNARWQLSMFGTYRLPWDVDVAGTLLGREGAPSPYVVPQSLGLDGNRGVLMTPRIDTIRLDDVWNVDLRVEKRLRFRKTTVQLTADVFNVLNGNAALMRERNLRSPNFDRVTLNVSPRILRMGLRLAF